MIQEGPSNIRVRAPSNEETIVKFSWFCELLSPIQLHIHLDSPTDHEFVEDKVSAKPKPSQPLNWSLECQAVFKMLKSLFATEPVLKHLTQMNPL